MKSRPRAGSSWTGSEVVRLAYRDLETAVQQLFQACGIPEGKAGPAAKALCYGDLSGHQSHGVENLMRIYMPQIKSREIEVSSSPEVIRSSGGHALIDAHRTIGLYTASWAMDAAIQRARAHGVGLVGVRNSTHFGCAGYHAKRAAARSMIGIAMSNCGSQQIVAAPEGQAPLLGTNPLSVAVPCDGLPPLLLDMSTTVAAMGRVYRAARRGDSIPHGWLVDEDANPVTDPATATGAVRPLPLGGQAETGAHKGFGLALVVEILTGLLTGADVAPLETKDSHDETRREEVSGGVGHLFIALDVGLLRSRTEFLTESGVVLANILQSTPRRGHPVMYAGYPESLSEQEHLRDGVPLEREVYRSLRQLMETHDVEPPRLFDEARPAT